MSESQFRRALRKHGFDVPGFGPFFGPMGYVRLPIEGCHVSVSVRNARSTKLRDVLAYLLQEKSKHEAKAESGAPS